MKKILFIFILFAQVKLFSQTLPNGTFENWSSVAYYDPTGFTTANIWDIQRLGIASVTRVTGYSGYALRVQTHVVGSDTSDSYVINTDNPCSDPDQWTGGVPFSQQPTALTGYYRYDLPGNDSALIIVIFRKNGIHIGDNFFLIRGTGSQATFASFSLPVTCAGVPDSVIIAVASSNKMINSGIQNGSFIELDNLAFAGTTQAIPNGDFENWTAKSYDVPGGWETWNSGASKTTSSYAGSYAVRLETISDCGGSNVNSSGITTGHMTPNNGPEGGRPFTNMIDTLCGYYKYTSMGNDSAMVVVNISRNHINIGGNMHLLPAAANYTYFEIPLWVGGALNPDTLRVDIASSNWGSTTAANSGSVLYVDNVWLKSQALGISENSIQSVQSFVYPNPVHDFVNIRLLNAFSGNLIFRLYDVTGKMITESGLYNSGTLLSIPANYLEAGMYFYEVSNRTVITRNKFIKE